MQQNKKVFGNIFLTIAVLGVIFLATEMVLQSFGRSICLTEGCSVVSRQTRFGDVSILLIGLLTFCALAVLSFLSLYRNRPQCERYINLLLVVSLAGEGFFAGYQVFRIHAVCVSCMITLVFFLLLGLLRLLSGEKQVVAGFLSFASVFALFYLVLPAGSTVSLPDDQLVLFYSKDCKYCAEVIDEIRENRIDVRHLLVGEYSGLLKNVGIEHVPTLLVNKGNQKMFLTGKEAIDQYLFCKQEEVAKKETRPKAISKTDKKSVSGGKSGEPRPFELLPPVADPASPFIQPDGEGMCKETEKCD